MAYTAPVHFWFDASVFVTPSHRVSPSSHLSGGYEQEDGATPFAAQTTPKFLLLFRANSE